ncbi:MAG TPA: hypothetical protein VNY53_06360 [Bradyrhizobium sp.]|nr:hypothetical protein [Bradyrhizobium sp.]
MPGPPPKVTDNRAVVLRLWQSCDRAVFGLSVGRRFAQLDDVRNGQITETPRLNSAKLSIVLLLATATAFSSLAQTPAVSAGGGSGLARPATQAQLQALLQAAMNGQSVMFDPTTAVTVSSTMTILVPDNPGNIFGNGLKIRSAINNGSDVLQFVGNAKANSRNFIIQGISIYGGGYGGQASGNCLVINAPHNKGSLYRVMLRDIYADFCGIHGVKIVGDFFESTLDNIESENNNGDGLFIDHGSDGGIISNLMIRSPNLSRNKGYGFHAARANSIDISQGSFINNGKGGLLGEHGIRTVDSVNCENSGLVCIDIPTSDFMTRLVGNNASSDGKTAVTTTMQYTYRYNGIPANLIQSGNYFTYYGSGTHNTAVRAP